MSSAQSLIRLRRLRGLSVGELAERAGLPEERVRALEAGEHDEGGLERVLDLYNLDLDCWYGGQLEPREGPSSSTASIFLFQGAYQDFSYDDLAILEPALQQARLAAGLLSEGVRQRLSLWPVPVAGPSRGDAAQQGYLLARRLRAALRLGAAPLGDLGVMLEERLGIVVLVAELRSRALRAAAILDQGRAGAAAVLSHALSPSGALFTRNALAHEVCHLTFDPASPGAIQIALDDDRSADRRPTEKLADLRESRARGFSAELLLPRDGVVELLGPPREAQTGEVEARRLVRLAARHFGAPSSVTANHLFNLGYYGRDIRGQLEQSPEPLGVIEGHITSLPAAGAPPRRLQGWAPPTDADVVRVSRQVQQASRAFQAEIHAADAEEVTRVLDLITATAQQGEPRVTANLLAAQLDDALLRGAFGVVSQLLDRLDPSLLPPAALTAALMLTGDARLELGASRERYLRRVQESLARVHGWDANRIQRMVDRLA